MADEKILKQLDDDASVIGYQPDLEYKKERTATGKAIISNDEEANYDPEKDTTLYTKTLNGFANNMPSNVLKDIDYVLKNIDRLKKKLAQRFNEDRTLRNNPFYNSSSTIDPNLIIGNTDNPSYNPYNNIGNLIDANNNGDEEFANHFEQMYNSIYGSVIPGLINKLSKIEAKLNALSITYKQLYYAKPNITLPEAQEIDHAYIVDLKIHERNGNHGKINYLMLSFDSILNKIVSYTVFQDNKSAIKVAKVIDSHDDTQATSNDMDLVNKMFDDIEKELDLRSRGYQRNEDLELIQKSMYNYYEKRKYLNDLYSLYSKNKESKFLGRKVTEYTKNLDVAMKNVGRVLMYNQSYLDQITSLEKQKYNLQKISGSTSSNS